MIFYPLKGFENLYFISKNSTIKNADGLVLKPFLSSDNYKRITLFKNNKKRNYYLHRLVAKQFLPNVENLKEVDHRDKNRQNNNISNLRWTTRKENCNNKTNNLPKPN